MILSIAANKQKSCIVDVCDRKARRASCLAKGCRGLLRASAVTELIYMSNIMSIQKIIDVNVISTELVPTPRDIKEQLPVSEEAIKGVIQARRCVEAILDGRDPRLFLLVGPCSIHDLSAAREYADKLKVLSQKVEDTFVVLMRVYFSKPRTTVGWKGLINDPRLDDSFRIDEGLFKAREFLRELADRHIAVGTEALDAITPQYMDDLITWHAVGARTTESQTHREMASGLSTPVGFKNATDGAIDVAVNAIKAARNSHHFLGINYEGQCVVLRTRGNQYAHMVLRGGSRPNYDSVSIALCEEALHRAGLPVNIMVDCSHDNSFKNPDLQPLVMKDCVSQILEGNNSIVGMMIESHLHSGRQEVTHELSKLRYGVSITDACIDWPTTESMILEARQRLAPYLASAKRRSAPEIA